MVLGHGKIPGHSGTACKHRKAFQGRSLLSQSNLPNPKHFDANSSSPGKLSPFGTLHWGMKLFQGLLFVAVLMTILYISWGSRKQFVGYHQTIQLQQRQTALAERDYRYNFFTSRGDDFRRVGNWEAAQEEYGFALIAQPKGTEALRGMTLTLLAKCYLYQTDCSSAKTYLSSLSIEVRKEIGGTLQLEEILQTKEPDEGAPFPLQP